MENTDNRQTPLSDQEKNGTAAAPNPASVPRTKGQRILALIGVVILAALYLTALISSFFDSDFARSMLMAALFCTIVIPAMIYLFGRTLAWFSGKDTRKDKRQTDQ